MAFFLFLFIPLIVTHLLLVYVNGTLVLLEACKLRWRGLRWKQLLLLIECPWSHRFCKLELCQFLPLRNCFQRLDCHFSCRLSFDLSRRCPFAGRGGRHGGLLWEPIEEVEVSLFLKELVKITAHSRLVAHHSLNLLFLGRAIKLRLYQVRSLRNSIRLQDPGLLKLARISSVVFASTVVLSTALVLSVDNNLNFGLRSNSWLFFQICPDLAFLKDNCRRFTSTHTSIQPIAVSCLNLRKYASSRGCNRSTEGGIR